MTGESFDPPPSSAFRLVLDTPVRELGPYASLAFSITFRAPDLATATAWADEAMAVPGRPYIDAGGVIHDHPPRYWHVEAI